jgi:hypothetical protein
MATYKFEEFNVEIVDPIVRIDPIVEKVDPIKMTISANIVLETMSAKFGLILKEIAVVDLNYNAEQLEQRVMERLNDFIVV